MSSKALDFRGPFTLKYSVYDGKHEVIVKGTPNVYIAFGASDKTYFDRQKMKRLHKNIYKWNGIVYDV